MSIDLLMYETQTPGMACKPRLDFPGAFFHVIARGNQRATIFHDEADYHPCPER